MELLRKLTEVKVELGHKSYKLNVLGLYVLHSLSSGPKNGYDLLKELKRLTNNKWVPPKSTIYPLLKKMVEEGLLEVDEYGVYTLTDAGRAVLRTLRRNSETIDELEENISLILRIIKEIKSEAQTQE